MPRRSLSRDGWQYSASSGFAAPLAATLKSCVVGHIRKSFISASPERRRRRLFHEIIERRRRRRRRRKKKRCFLFYPAAFLRMLRPQWRPWWRPPANEDTTEALWKSILRLAFFQKCRERESERASIDVKLDTVLCETRNIHLAAQLVYRIYTLCRYVQGDWLVSRPMFFKKSKNGLS